MFKVICFGAAHIDIKAFAQQKIIWGDKNPVSSSLSLGGVARNIAENLSHLGVDVAICSLIGADQNGELVKKSLLQHNIDIKMLNVSKTKNTASYTALIEPHGDMAVAFSDMDIYDDFLINEEQLKSYTEAKIWLMDANIPEHVMSRIVSICPPHVELWAAGTSVVKNQRFLSVINRIKVLIVNQQEAEEFNKKNPEYLVITRGERGASIFIDDSYYDFPAHKQTVMDTTGAGDAFVAGLLFGYVCENNLLKAMPFALACASLAIKSKNSVCSSLSSDLLLKTIKSYMSKGSSNDTTVNFSPFT